MIRTVYYICGRPRVAVRVASCSGGKYINYANPSKNNTKLKQISKTMQSAVWLLSSVSAVPLLPLS